MVRAAVAVARVAQQARQVRALHTQKSFLRNLPPTGSCGATLTAAGALAVHGHCGLRIALPRMPARARRAGEPFSAVSWPCWGPFWGPCLTVYIFIDRLGINGTLHRSPHRLLYRACRASQAVTVAAPFVSLFSVCAGGCGRARNGYRPSKLLRVLSFARALASRTLACRAAGTSATLVVPGCFWHDTNCESNQTFELHRVIIFGFFLSSGIIMANGGITCAKKVLLRYCLFVYKASAMTHHVRSPMSLQSSHDLVLDHVLETSMLVNRDKATSCMEARRPRFVQYPPIPWYTCMRPCKTYQTNSTITTLLPPRVHREFPGAGDLPPRA